MKNGFASRFFCCMGILLACSFASSAAYVDYWATNFTTSKKFNYRVRQSFDMGWKFYKGTPSGTPYQTTYSDASWHNADVPHSFDEYTVAPDNGYYDGDAWYRKTFTLPDTSAGKKVVIEFEGVMQTADVYVNGQFVGRHDNSGYTEFMFDITAFVNRTGTNVIAVKDNNHNVDSIPPGISPDYCLHGGIYRDVWLWETDSVHVPLWKQYVSTPTVSTSSAAVKVVTTLANDKKQAQTCTVTYVILDSTGAQVATQSAQQSVPAGGTSVFTMNSTISSPKLWSTTTPYLYKVYTTVSVGGVIIDDFWERFGARTITWSNTNGLLINGTRVQVIGTCLHQDFGWVQNAVPTSRYYKIIEEIKDAGFNAYRCSHYPRDPSFYDACDETGMIIVFETPSSGWGKSSYPAGFWTRSINCWREMVVQAYNHPCIIGFGYMNEPYQDQQDFSPYFAQEKQFADSIDPNLPKYYANCNCYDRAGAQNLCTFFGANYWAPTSVAGVTVPVMTTEYIGFATAVRGDQANEDNWGAQAWSSYQQWLGDGPRDAGSFLWCMMDYKPGDTRGYVDRCHVPKRGWYLLRKNLTGKADDNYVTGTATMVSLEPDLTDLRADGSDFSRIVVALRNASGQCINSNKSVTLSLSGTGAVLCGPTTITTIAGKLGVVVHASETAGTTKIIATSSGLASDTITLTTHALNENPVIALRPIGINTIKKMATYHFAISRYGIIADRIPAGALLKVYNTLGSVVATLGGNLPSHIRTSIAPGIYFSRLEENGVCLNTRVNVVR
jgi:hypothetical protein